METTRNVAANFLGSGWSAFVGLVFVPFYIQAMGVEAYGLVGVFTSLMAALVVFDLGLSHAMSREAARYSGSPREMPQFANMTRTLEVIYWAMGGVIGGLLALLAEPIAYHWLNPESMSREAVRHAVWGMALVVALRWPMAIYLGGLNGLQRQVIVNAIGASAATVQNCGALAVLWFVSPTVQTFFEWQAVAALGHVIALRCALWKTIGCLEGCKFSIDSLRQIWRFAAGMTGVAIVTTILTQVDKILLSKLLSLTEFGYYTVAASVAAVLYRLVGPVFTAYAPRLTVLVSRGSPLLLESAYHQGCQLMAVVVLPASCVLLFFSGEVMYLWTRNSALVAGVADLLVLLVLGNMLNGLMHIPYALQLAHGWTTLAFWLNLSAAVTLVPLIYFATISWGAVGAAAVWVVLNLSYSLLGIHLMYQKLLKTAKWKWYWNDLLKPLMVTLIVVGIFKLGLNHSASNWVTVIVIVASWIASSIMVVLICPTTRAWAIRRFATWQSKQ